MAASVNSVYVNQLARSGTQGHELRRHHLPSPCAFLIAKARWPILSWVTTSLKAIVLNFPFFGALVGRYAKSHRQRNVYSDGKKYTLPKNDGPNTLPHMEDPAGFDKAMWDGEPVKGKNAVAFIYTSKDGEEGFPGNLESQSYSILNDNNEVVIDYEAPRISQPSLTPASTVISICSGEGSGDILNTEMEINASRFTPVDSIAGFPPASCVR